jgi:enoyl-CoA hydratase/carnithine racemase
VVPHEELASTVATWAAELAAQPPLAVAAAKRTMRLGLDTTFEANAHHVLAELLTLFRTKDFAEGVAAFMERRPPTYQGR